MNAKTVTYKLKVIDSFRFLSSSLSSLVNNLSEIYSEKCKDKYCKSECEYLEITNFLIGVVSARKKQLKLINKLIKKFRNTYTFCNNDINRFILLLRKGVYPYEYMGIWERFDEISLPDKKYFIESIYRRN